MSGWRSYASRYTSRARKTVSSTASSVKSTLNKATSEALKQTQKARQQFSRYIPNPRQKLNQLKKMAPLLKELANLKRKLSGSRTTITELYSLLKKILPRKYGGTASLRGSSAHREIESFLRRKGISLDNLKTLAKKVGITGELSYVAGLTGELKSVTGVDAGAGLAIRLDSRYPEYGWYVFGSGAIGGVAEKTIGVQEGIYFRSIRGMPGPYMAIEASSNIPFSSLGMLGVKANEINFVFDHKGASGVIIGYTTGISVGVNGALGVLVAQLI